MTIIVINRIEVIQKLEIPDDADMETALKAIPALTDAEKIDGDIYAVEVLKKLPKDHVNDIGIFTVDDEHYGEWFDI